MCTVVIIVPLSVIKVFMEIELHCNSQMNYYVIK